MPGLTDAGVTKDVLSYGSEGMPPVVRMRKGEAFAARLVNGIDEPTTIHWHGLRIPNRMDGVPFLTQPYVYTGDKFDYAFTPPDAGTFWYHPHCNTLTQMGHGLTGVIVVENPNDPKFDAEVVLNLRDWRLGGDGQFIDQFRPRDAAKSGTYGTVRTANWQQQPQYDAPAGGLVRVRIAITDVTRVYTFKLDGGEAAVIAIDGNPVPSRFALDVLTLGPGQRLELAVRMPDSEGAVVTLSDVRGTNSEDARDISRRRHVAEAGDRRSRAAGDQSRRESRCRISPAHPADAERNSRERPRSRQRLRLSRL